MYYQQTDIQTLRQRANQNLIALRDRGSHQLRMAAAAERRERLAERRRQEREEKAEKKARQQKARAELAVARQELAELTKTWGFLLELDDLDGFVADMGVPDRVVLEEVGYQEDVLRRKIERLEEAANPPSWW